MKGENDMNLFRRSPGTRGKVLLVALFAATLLPAAGEKDEINIRAIPSDLAAEIEKSDAVLDAMTGPNGLSCFGFPGRSKPAARRASPRENTRPFPSRANFFVRSATPVPSRKTSSSSFRI